MPGAAELALACPGQVQTQHRDEPLSLIGCDGRGGCQTQQGCWGVAMRAPPPCTPPCFLLPLLPLNCLICPAFHKSSSYPPTRCPSLLAVGLPRWGHSLCPSTKTLCRAPPAAPLPFEGDVGDQPHHHSRQDGAVDRDEVVGGAAADNGLRAAHDGGAGVGRGAGQHLGARGARGVPGDGLRAGGARQDWCVGCPARVEVCQA